MQLRTHYSILSVTFQVTELEYIDAYGCSIEQASV